MKQKKQVKKTNSKSERQQAPSQTQRKRSRGARLAASQPAPAGPQRLQKVLAAAGVVSRRQAEELIVAGRVRVNGRVVQTLGTRADPEREKITVDGNPIQMKPRVYILLNKPDGVVCSAEGVKDDRERPTVLSLLPSITDRIYPVGRLDYHSRGALILTNDGDFAAALTHPSHGVTKTYHVKFQGQLTMDELERLEQGVVLEDGTKTKPLVELSIIRETQTNTWVQMVLKQGLYRQIRRMGEAIDHPVLKIIRVAIGTITADGLADGEFRPLTPAEVYELRTMSNML